VNVNSEVGQIMANYMNMKEEKFPKLLIHDTRKIRPYHFLFSQHFQEYTEENIVKFVNEWENGKLTPFYRSENASLVKQDNKNINYIVGNNFESFALDPTKDVLVMFYADNCTQCEDYFPLFNKFADKIKGSNGTLNENLVIGKFNYSRNETKQIYTERYPTFALFPSNNKTDFKFLLEQMTVESLSSFIQKHASLTLTIDDL